MTNPVGRPRKPRRVKFSSSLRPADAELMAEKAKDTTKCAVLDAAFDALREIEKKKRLFREAIHSPIWFLVDRENGKP